MSVVLPVQKHHAAQSWRAPRSLSPLTVAVAVACAVTLVRIFGTVDSDVAWQLWVARQIHAGADLYTDIIETNPPLWFWMAVPAERMSAILGLRAEPVLVLLIGIAVIGSLAATDRLVSHIRRDRRLPFLAYAAIAMAAMPWLHVGQREQIVLIGTIPYAALMAARQQGQAIHSSLAVAVGIGAALGFALKHYFLAVPLALELWLMLSLRREWRLFRPETLALASVITAYVGSICLIEPDFITRIVPLIHLAYGVFGRPIYAVLLNLHAVAGVLILAVAATQIIPLASARVPVATALTVASTVFAAVYFVQFKGWPYHALPLIGCGSVALAARLAEAPAAPLLRVLVPAALLLPIGISAQETRQIPEWQPDLAEAVAGLRKGDTVAFITAETAVPWSVTLQGGYLYPSRYNGFWQMQAIADNERSPRPDPRVTALGHQIVAETVADFTCMPPRRIIVMRPRPGEAGFDILAFYARSPDFADLMSHYRVRSRTSLDTYELASRLPAPSAPCRGEHG
ncbi:hypothetical protein G7078_08930 [Sphingomonas sinipercae]|uniref:Glycosyltransferase RgtA/B/C/D-like domain-containing protein n=1 Tax=Sphingomonas sinipercae TaxID=2714944 RepID=A0A6G7ZPN8_9SPHN|nr:hypothetical protein [Sphingomonas sinipercae]QIL02895.1 hypothetical protein G7078_08930 [Sphingomonas sinipercae]